MAKEWLKSYPEGVPHDITVTHENLIELFAASCSQYGDQVAVSNFGCQLTYQQLAELSRDFAAFLQQELGLQKGERFAIMLPNLLQYPVVLLAALQAGLAVVNINPLYTADELTSQLNDSQTETIIVAANFAHTVAEALPNTSLKRVIVTELGDLLSPLKRLLLNFIVKTIKKAVPAYNIPNVIDFRAALALGARKKFNPLTIAASDTAFLQYTGGTTGVVKAAILTHANVVANVAQIVAWIKPASHMGKEVMITALPLYHIFALTVNGFAMIAIGAESVLVTNPRDMKRFIALLRKTSFSLFTGVNTLFNGLLAQPAFRQIDFSHLKFVIAGGMALQQAVAEEWQAVTGGPLLEGYGLTEASPVVTVNPLDLKTYNGSIGLPIPSTDVCIQDEAGNCLAAGEEGELCIKGPQVMQQYWQQPEETALVIDAQGWLHSGDIATMDEKGFLKIVDRKKDMIDVSGFNVYPNEVEAVIAKIPEVLEVGVVGYPSPDSGELVKAFIVKKDNQLTAERVLVFCREHLTRYKVPKEVEFVDALPKSNVGKILRRELKSVANEQNSVVEKTN